MNLFLNKVLEKLPKLSQSEVSYVQQLIEQVQTEYDQLYEVVNSIKEGIIVTDLHHTLTMYNKVAQIFLSIKKMKGRQVRIWDVIEDPEIASYVREVLVSNIDSTRQFTFSVGGVTRTYEFNLLPWVRKGTIAGNILKIEDRTEELTQEARLYNAERLASLTSLTANVAHEIKNPLGSIAIYAQLTQRALESPAIDKERITNNTQVIIEEIERLNSIINDFLFAVRPMKLKKEEININGLLEEVVEFYKMELSTHKIRPKIFLKEVPAIEADPRYIKEVLYNIIKNAMDAMPKGGLLTFSTNVVNGMVEVAIIDNGVGMSSDTLKRIFDPYYTTKDYGSGIGLTQAYKIVKEHQGTIDVTSSETVGTICKIAFPISRSVQQRLSEVV